MGVFGPLDDWKQWSSSVPPDYVERHRTNFSCILYFDKLFWCMMPLSQAAYVYEHARFDLCQEEVKNLRLCAAKFMNSGDKFALLKERRRNAYDLIPDHPFLFRKNFVDFLSREDRLPLNFNAAEYFSANQHKRLNNNDSLSQEHAQQSMITDIQHSKQNKAPAAGTTPLPSSPLVQNKGSSGANESQ